MTTDVVEKCARAIHAESDDRRFNWDSLQGVQRDDFRDMALAVIDALADGVTDEMGDAALAATTGTNAEASKQRDGEDFSAWGSRLRKTALSAAIRAAKSRETA